MTTPDQTQAAPTHPSACNQFYSDPTPANAVRLAIEDARADENGTPEFFEHLNRAAMQLESHAQLVAALEICLHSMTDQFPDGLPIQRGTLCEEQDWDTGVRLARAALAAVKGGA